VWWHLPLLALGFGGLAVAFTLLRAWLWARKARNAERIMEKLYSELWDAWTWGHGFFLGGYLVVYNQ